METQSKHWFTVAIIGGRASGTLTAYHLLLSNASIRVLLIEPRPAVGVGLAYSSPSMRHLLNVPAGRISAIPSDPHHFLRWLHAHHYTEANAGTFAPRAVFGRYVQSLSASVTGLEHIHAEVVSYREDQSGAAVTLSDGTMLRADRVILATGNFDPASLPGISADAADQGLYAHNAWLPASFADLDADAPVTLIGSGLTAADVLLHLREQGHRGQLTMVSRHAILPQRHMDHVPADGPAIPSGTPATTLAYLRALRTALASGMEWRTAIDSLRGDTNALWLSLPLREQRRFRRHLQRRWDVLRHRMAPPIADIIEAELAAGTLVLREGSLAGVQARAGTAVVTSRKAGVVESHTAARVINCTGPDMRYERVASPLLRSLFEQGIATSGPLGTGFRCNADGALLNTKGQPSPTLFNLGPGRLGTLLESIAMPEIREQAFALAQLLAAQAQLYVHPEAAEPAHAA
jgi:uncharacterized NAD(P)/FAD-binding protein YdhS